MIEISLKDGQNISIKDNGQIEVSSDALLEEFAYDINNKANNVTKVEDNR